MTYSIVGFQHTLVCKRYLLNEVMHLILVYTGIILAGSGCRWPSEGSSRSGKTVPFRPDSQESLEDGLLGKPARERSIAGRFTHTIGSVNEYYYVGGPQQARPSEGAFSKGTKVRLVRDAGSYSLVQSETGITAYVTTGCLKKID